MSIRGIIQKLFRGYTYLEISDLDHTISRFVVPRLKEFKKLNDMLPDGLTEEEWNNILDDMIWFHESPLSYYLDAERYKQAGEYWGKYYKALWF